MKKSYGLAIGVFLWISHFACSQVVREAKVDAAVISSDSAPVRSSTAQLALEVATLKKGDEVEVLEHRGNDWSKIRTQGGVVGWTQTRYLVSRTIVDRGKELSDRASAIPAQALGRLTGQAALRVSPGRASDRNIAFYLPGAVNVEILTRGRTLRMNDELIPPQFTAKSAREARARRSNDASVQYDYWYQVRLPGTNLFRVGWVYSPLVEIRVPPRLQNLQGDKLIIGWFEIGELNDEESGPTHHYLTMERDRYRPTVGIDFDRIKLFVWDLQRHQYGSTWQRVYGLLPVRRTVQDNLHAFELQAFNEKTGAPEKAVFTVDVREGRRLQLTRVKEKQNATRR